MPRQKKPINWDLVEKKMEAGCSAKEIASTFDICLDTFYPRFKEEFGRSFSDISEERYLLGNGNIKLTQYAKAMSGNIHMLILLGKERLGQGKEQDKQSPFEDTISLRHENMMLRAEIERVKEILDGIQQ